MASAAEIENDLRARAKINQGRHKQGRMLDDDARSMLRAADMIKQQREVILELEQAAQEADDRLEAYQNGDDLYGATS